MNWTQDSWSRQENVIAIVLARPRSHTPYAQLRRALGDGHGSAPGHVEPRPVDVGDGIEVRPWFTPEHGEALSHRIAKRIGQAKRRVRIASPVLSSGPILGTLAEVCRTATWTSPASSTTRRSTASSTSGDERVSAGRSRSSPLPRGAPFAGKPSTKWAPDTVHDFMHAKVTVADDISFIGSFNLSHSGEMNAENVLEIHDAAIADRLAHFVDEIRALYPRSPRRRIKTHGVRRHLRFCEASSSSRVLAAVAAVARGAPAAAGARAARSSRPTTRGTSGSTRCPSRPTRTRRRGDRRRRPHARRLRLRPLGRRPDRDPDHGRRQDAGEVTVSFQYADESDKGPYPIPTNVAIEGGRVATATGTR